MLSIFAEKKRLYLRPLERKINNFDKFFMKKINESKLYQQ